MSIFILEIVWRDRFVASVRLDENNMKMIKIISEQRD